MIFRTEITEIVRFFIRYSIYAKSKEKALTFGLLTQTGEEKMCLSALVFISARVEA